MNAFSIVEQFEHRIAEFTRAKYAVAVLTGTAAIFLCLQFRKISWRTLPVLKIPARTFISVPMTAIQCGYQIEFDPETWWDSYEIAPLQVFDSALCFHKNMFTQKHNPDALECISFQARKILNIGEGGMILTDNDYAADWLRAARYSGRKPPHYRIEDVSMLGWQMYMIPEKAARGLHLMEYIGDGEQPLKQNYPDLRPVFERIYRTQKGQICETTK